MATNPDGPPTETTPGADQTSTSVKTTKASTATTSATTADTTPEPAVDQTGDAEQMPVQISPTTGEPVQGPTFDPPVEQGPAESVDEPVETVDLQVDSAEYDSVDIPYGDAGQRVTIHRTRTTVEASIADEVIATAARYGITIVRVTDETKEV